MNKKIKVIPKFNIGNKVYIKRYELIREIKEIMSHIYKTKNGNIKRRIFYSFIGCGDLLIEQKDCCAVKEDCYKCNVFSDCQCCKNFLDIIKNNKRIKEEE